MKYMMDYNYFDWKNAIKNNTNKIEVNKQCETSVNYTFRENVLLELTSIEKKKYHNELINFVICGRN